jgi:hypothetical protein
VFIISCAAVMIVVVEAIVIVIFFVWPHLLKQWKSDNARTGERWRVARRARGAWYR